MDELPVTIIAQKKHRSSVSAEAYGIWNKKADFVPRVITKSED